MKRRLKINGVIIFVAFILTAAFPAIFFRKEKITFLDQAAEISGVALILLGQIIRVSSRGYKSENSQGGHALIQDGPYSLVRNPMYLGIFLIGMGIVSVLFNCWAGGFFLLVFIIRYLILVFKEEKRLLLMFPEDYPAYKKRTPRILPYWKMLLQDDISEYLPLKVPWLKKEIGPISAVLFITFFIESWEDIQNKGIGVYFKEALVYLTIIILFGCTVIYLSRRTINSQRYASDKSKDN